jgi:Fic family protein
MFSQGLLSRPNFYLSEFLERNRGEYYDRLLAVSRDGDWTGWCEFFLRAIIAQAETNQSKAKAILDLYQNRKDWVAEVTKSQYAVRALDWMFVRPVFKTSDFAASVDIPGPTASRILRVLRAEGMLEDLRPASGRRAGVVAFGQLLDIADGN